MLSGQENLVVLCRTYLHPSALIPCRIHSLDFGISERVQFKESMYLGIRGDFFNALNTPRFAFPDTTFGSDTFGVINSQANSPRHGQFGLRFAF